MKSYQNNANEESDLLFEGAAISQGNAPVVTSHPRGRSTILLAAFALAGSAILAFSSLHAANHIRGDGTTASISRVPLLGKSKKKNEGPCSDVASSVYAEFGFVESDNLDAIINDATIAIMPTEEKNVFQYFLWSGKPVPGLGDEYLEHGFLRFGEGDNTYDPTRICHGELEMYGFYENQWVPDTKPFDFATWDGGVNWLVSGAQDFSEDMKTTQVILFTSIHGHKNCKHRVKKMIASYKGKGIKVPDGVADFC